MSTRHVTPPSPAPRARRVRRALLVVLLALIASCAAALTGYATRDRWTPRALAWAARRFAGIELEVGSVAWRGLEHADVKGLRAAPASSSAAWTSLDVGELAIDLDLGRVLRAGLAGISSIEADRAHVALDLTRSSASSSTSATPHGRELAWPGGLPRARLRRVDVDAKLAGDRELELRGADASLEPSSERGLFRVSAQSAEYRDPEHVVSHPLAIAFEWSGSEIDVTELAFDPRVQTRHAHFDLAGLARGELDARAELAAFEGTGTLHAHLSKTELSADLRARAVNVRAALDAVLGASAPDVAARADIDVELALPTADAARARVRAFVDAVDVRAFGRTASWVRGDLAIDERAVRASDLFVAEGPNCALLPDLRVPRDAQDACEILERASCSFEAEIQDLRALLEPGETAQAEGALPEHRAHVVGRVFRGAIELDGGTLETVGGHLTIARGHVPISENVRTLLQDPQLALSLNGRFDDLGPLVAILGGEREEWRGAVEASIDLRASRRGGLRGFADVRGARLRVLGHDFETVSAHIEASRERIDVDELDVQGADAILSIGGSYALATHELVRGHAYGWIADPSFIDPKLSAHGELELDVEAHGVWPALDGRLSAKGASFDAGSVHLDRAVISARCEQGAIAIDDLEIERGIDRIRAQGRVGTLAALVARSLPMCIDLDALAWHAGDREIDLVDPVELTVDTQGVAFDGLALVADGGALTARITSFGPAGSVRAVAKALDASPWIERFARVPIRAPDVDLDLDARWSTRAVDVAAHGRVLALEVGAGSPAPDVDFAFSLKEKRLVVERLGVALRDEPPLVLAGELPLDVLGPELFPDGPLRLSGAFDLADVGRFVHAIRAEAVESAGSLHVGVDLEGTVAAPRGHVTLAGRDLSLQLGRGAKAVGPWSLSGSLDLDRDVTVHDFVLDLAAGLHATLSGHATGPFSLADALHQRADAWSRSPLELDLAIDAKDLSALSPWLAGTRRVGGEMHADLKLSGTPAEPKFAGTLAVEHAEVRTASAIPAMSDVVVKLAFDGDRVHVDDIHGEMGGAIVHLGGDFYPFARGAEDRRLDLTLEGDNLLVYRSRGFRLRADAKLTIRGGLDAPAVGGTLALRDSRFTQDFEFFSVFGTHRAGPTIFTRPLFELPPPWDKITFDVALHSATPFVVSTNVVQGGLRAELQLVGTGALPLLRGSVVIDPTRVILPSGTITTRSGHLEFLPASPFEPQIEAIADARMQGYTVSMHISGTIEAPIVDLSSIPPLEHEDLLMLVLTGRVPREDQKSPTGTRAAQQVAAYFANDVVGSWFRGDEVNPDPYDTAFEVETGKELSQSGQEATAARVRVWKGVFSRSSSLYLTGERDVYDRYNYGLRVLFRFQ